MARQRGGTEHKLIEKIFDQLSSSVSIALLKNDKLAYEFYGGRKAALSDGAVGAKPGISRVTRFNLGSASSLFTGALAVKFMEFGDVRLNDPARRFIPEFTFGDVSVYHLMTHTSGLDCANLPLPDNYAAKREFFRKLYGGLSQAAAPGVVSEFFQYNYAILADIIERISGQMIEELAASLLFMPLGMKYTTYNGVALKANQYVAPWSHIENRFMNELHAKQPTGQSGVYTTALDLLRFGRMILNGGASEDRPVFLESSVGFILKEITAGKFMRTPLFMVKGKADAFGCFSDQNSAEAVATTGNTGSLFFIDPYKRVVGAALTNSTWVHALSQNYNNIADILMAV